MRSVLGILLAFMMLATACGATASDSVTAASQGAATSTDDGTNADTGADTDNGEDSGDDGNQDDAEADTDDGPQSFEEIEFDSPLAELLGFDFGAGEDSQAQQQEMEREAGRLTAVCMREQGFEFIPPPTSAFSTFGPGGDELPYFSDEWVDKYGFGITTQRFAQSSVGSDLVGYDDAFFDDSSDNFPEDPNQEYLDSLSDGEREAYDTALYGTFPDFGPECPDEDFEFEPTGCQFEAFEEAFSQGSSVDLQAFFETFEDQLEAMEDRARSDPEVLAFADEVNSCVSEAGMTFVDMEDLYMRFEPRLNELQPQSGFTSDPFEGTGLDPEEMSETELNDFFRELERLDPAQLAVLAELQAEELSLARVVVDCGGGPLNEQVVLGQVRAKYEQQFLDENAAEIATLIDE